MKDDTISRQVAIENSFEVYTKDYGWCEVVGVDALLELPSVQPEQRWIPCKKQMPEPDSWAIWCSRKGLIQVARWKEDAIDHFWPGQGFFELEDAVAWISLPEPYREEECDEPDKQTD